MICLDYVVQSFFDLHLVSEPSYISSFIRVCANFIFMKICNAMLIFKNARYFGLTFLLGCNILKLFYNNFDVFCVFK